MSDTSRPPTLCRPTIRQGGREMSAPRPYETSPFHPPALFTPNTKINLYIYTNLFQLFLSCGNCIASRNICYLRVHSYRTTYFKIQRHFVLLRYVLVRDTDRNIALAQSMFEFIKENGEHNVRYNFLLPLAIERPNGTFRSNFQSML